ncbi:MAG: site-2 protease family protein [Kiritimatiellae bacterium]|nr:site-2 protease family protein [Kiritimatiellia bacterium]
MKYSSIKIISVWGIPIRLHVSLLLMTFLLCTKFGILWGLVIQFALGLSIILHELGHCYVAIRKQCRVHEITLLVIGGAAHMERIPRKPMDELLMAIAGPAVSLVLALFFWFLTNVFPMDPLRTPVGRITILEICAWLNAVLFCFNLLPAFPMDGGRVLRAALSNPLGRLRATAISARLGKLFGALMILSGMLNTPVMVNGDTMGFEPRSLMWVAIGFFVFLAAENEHLTVRVQEGDIDINDARGGFLAQHRKTVIKNGASPRGHQQTDAADIQNTQESP